MPRLSDIQVTTRIFQWLPLCLFALGSQALGASLADQSCSAEASDRKEETLNSAPDKMCTRGFDRPAFLLFTNGGVEFHLGTSVEIFEYGGSMGTGLNGQVIGSLNRVGDTDVIYQTEIEMDTNLPPTKGGVTTIMIFRDRVFWPCDFFEDLGEPGHW